MEMTKETEEKYKKAGKILNQVRDLVVPMIKDGASYLEVGDFAESKILELTGDEGGIGFPCNLSVNEVAAHDIPDINDSRVFKDGDVVKLDMGVHVDGYIADSAVTVIVGDNDLARQMYEVNGKALDAALKMFVPGQPLKEISQVIEEVIRGEGFTPIANLSGHGLDQYVVHTHPSVANIKTSDPYVLEEGDVCAIEPFVTNGEGFVNEMDKTSIFGYRMDRPIRLPEGRKILDAAKNKYSSLPFAERWLVDKGLSPLKLRMAMRQLVQLGAIKDYPALIEADKGLVTQKEHNVIVKDKPVVYTRG